MDSLKDELENIKEQFEVSIPVRKEGFAYGLFRNMSGAEINEALNVFETAVQVMHEVLWDKKHRGCWALDLRGIWCRAKVLKVTEAPVCWSLDDLRGIWCNAKALKVTD